MVSIFHIFECLNEQKIPEKLNILRSAVVPEA